MSRVVYLIGEPGSGKTSLAAQTMDACGLHRIAAPRPIPHEQLTRTDPADAPPGPGGPPELAGLPGFAGLHLGRARPGGFGGTDALSMSIQPAVLAWLATHPAGPDGLILGEGDRLATLSFFTALRQQGHQLRVVLLATPPATATARRERRAAQLGVAPQQPAWIAGRITKTRNLAAHASDQISGSDDGWPTAHRHLAAICGWAHLLYTGADA
jgi:hypothetical protein